MDCKKLFSNFKMPEKQKHFGPCTIAVIVISLILPQSNKSYSYITQ